MHQRHSNLRVIESQSAVLSNYEVLAHLTTSRAKPRTTDQKHGNVETVIKELIDYLRPPPPPASCSPITPYANSHCYSPETVAKLVERLHPYGLTKSELLMILNLRPTSLTLLDCVVEECDKRFSQQDQELIAIIIGNVLGGGDRVDGQGEEVNETDGNGVDRNGSGVGAAD